MTNTKNKRERRTFTDEFKNQMVQLYLNGKRRCDILKEYDLISSAFINGSNKHNQQVHSKKRTIEQKKRMSSSDCARKTNS